MNTYDVTLFSETLGKLETRPFNAPNEHTAAFMAGMEMGHIWVRGGGVLNESVEVFRERMLTTTSLSVNGSEPASFDAGLQPFTVTMSLTDGSEHGSLVKEGRDEFTVALWAGVTYILGWYGDFGFLNRSYSSLMNGLPQEAVVRVEEFDMTEDVNRLLGELFGEI